MASDEVSAPKGAAKYKSLISQFINGPISASDFESSYLKMLKNETEMIGGDASISSRTCSRVPMIM